MLKLRMPYSSIGKMKGKTTISSPDIDCQQQQQQQQREIEIIISHCIEKHIRQLHHPYHICPKRRLVIAASVRCNHKPGNGKPHDVETRIPLTLFHQWKRDLIVNRNKSNINKTTEDVNESIIATAACTASEQVALKQTNAYPSSPSSSSSSSLPVVTITSDLGLNREIHSPQQLANLLAPLLEEDFRNNPEWEMSPDVRSSPSGILSMITKKRALMLYNTGRLPCPYCIQWCNGTKGLWWHQQQYHLVEHSQATAVAHATTIGSNAIVIYDDNSSTGKPTSIATSTKRKSIDASTTTSENIPLDPIECIHRGDFESFKRAVDAHDYQPSTTFDTKGATALMWSAGCGNLEMTRYLIEYCGCDPSQPQRGKRRGFAGRTAFHWACRNGNLDIVRYLLTLKTAITSSSNNKGTVLLEAKTQDGTTAFGLACWQRHLHVMEFLHQNGCDIHALNSFGCSPVLWCSQGTHGDGLVALQWLYDKGCEISLINHNGHGILHKSAQRGQQNVAEWFVTKQFAGVISSSTENDNNSNSISTKQRENLLTLIGPDNEGYCPSDLAGMEKHTELAIYLATIEIRICRHLQCVPTYDIPKEYDYFDASLHVWEQYGGLRRMRCSLTHG